VDSRLKHRLWTLLRLALCVAALGYVFSRTDFRDKVWLKGHDVPVRLVYLDSVRAEVIQAGRPASLRLDELQATDDGRPKVSWGLVSLASRSNKGLFLLGLLLYGVQPLLQVVRFRWMLRLQNLQIDWPAAVSICFQGHFYSYVIPGTTGGDLVRAAYLMRNNANRHGGLVAIALDRLTGMAGMFALAGLAGLLIPIQQPTVRYAARVSLLVFACMVCGFAAVTGWQWVTRLLGRLPLGTHLQQFYDAASAGKRGWAVLLAAVALTMVLQAGAMVSFSFAAVALGMQPAWQQYFVCIPVALVIAAIPIVPMGVGTLEAAMIALLAQAGHVGSVSQVVGLALAMRIMGLIWALPGGLVPLLRPGTPVVRTPAR
jgi:glycosyltransferase 2 family protein